MNGGKTKAYQLIIESVFKKARLKADESGSLNPYELKKYKGKTNKGKTGHEYEIDVSFEAQIGDMNGLYLVEYKKHIQSVRIQHISSFSYRIKDIRAQGGILIVTTNAFDIGSINAAKLEGIVLLVAFKTRFTSLRIYQPIILRTWIDHFEVGLKPDGSNMTLLACPAVVKDLAPAIVPLQFDSPVEFGEEIVFLRPEHAEKYRF